jgi:hypothetical protein
MDDKSFENELKEIEEHTIYYLFGYYTRRLKIGLMNDEFNEMTEEQAKEIIKLLWLKLRDTTERVKE